MQHQEQTGLSQCLLNLKGVVSISSSCTGCSDHGGSLHRHAQWVEGLHARGDGAHC